MQRRFFCFAQLLFILVLVVSFGMSGSAVRRPQTTTGQGDFARVAAAAIAHGKRDEAQKIAAAPGSSEPAAAHFRTPLTLSSRKPSSASKTQPRPRRSPHRTR